MTQQFTLEDLKRILPDEHHRKSFLRLIGQLDSDSAAMMVLKGHLVSEEKITAAIDKFVFHPEELEGARTYICAQALNRAVNVPRREQKPDVGPCCGINKVRNTLAHSLEGESRRDAINRLRSIYSRERNSKLEYWEKNDEALLILSAVSHCLGFLDAFEQEVERFKDHVNMLDKVVPPHRHVGQKNPAK
jgi:hypothetical protein